MSASSVKSMRKLSSVKRVRGFMRRGTIPDAPRLRHIALWLTRGGPLAALPSGIVSLWPFQRGKRHDVDPAEDLHDRRGRAPRWAPERGRFGFHGCEGGLDRSFVADRTDGDRSNSLREPETRAPACRRGRGM